MVRLYESGTSLSELAELSGLSYGATRNRLRASGVRLRPPGGNQRPVRPRRLKVVEPVTYASLSDAVVALQGAGLNTYEVVRVTGQSYHRVVKGLTDAGVKGRRYSRVNIDPSRLEAVYRATLSTEVTGRILHVSKTTVRYRLREHGIEMQPPGGRPRTFTNEVAPVRIDMPAKPWEKEYRDIAGRFDRGQGTQAIAAELGIPLSTVLDALRAHRTPDRLAAEIIRRSGHEPPRIIAARLGVRPDQVRAVIAGGRP